MNQEINKNDWQNKLKSEETPMDIQQFWNQLEPKLPPQKKQRKGAWWFWSALVAVGLGVAILSVLLPTGQDDLVDDLVLNPVEQKVEARTELPMNGDLNSAATPEFSIKSNSQIEATSAQNNHVNNSKNNPTTTSESVDRTDVQNRVSGRIKPLTNARNNESQVAMSQSENEIQGTPVVQGPENQKKVTDNRVPELSHLLNTDQQIALVILPRRDIQLTEFIPDSWSPKHILPGGQNKKPVWQWAIALSGGPGIGIRKLSSKDLAYDGWIEQRRDQESVLESWQVRAMVEVVSPGGFVVEGGLQWSRQNERLDWSRDSSVWEWGQAEGFLVDQNGGTQPWADTAWQSFTLTRTIRHYNKISTLEIPIGLGYQWSTGRWSVRATGGVLINLNQRVSGASIHQDEWPVQWQSTTDTKLLTHLGLGYYGHLRFAYGLRDRINVFIQPTYSSYPGDRQEATSYSLKYGQANFQIGLQWRLN